MIRKYHDGEKLKRLEDVLADRPVRWHRSGMVFSPLTALRAVREKVCGTVASHGEIQVGLLLELRDVYLDAVRSTWSELPAAGRASLKARLPELAGPGEEFAESAARLANAVNAILAAHGVGLGNVPADAQLEYITLDERAALARAFEEEVEL